MPISTKTAYGAVSYSTFIFIVAHPFMNTFQLTVMGYFFAWAIVLGLCLSASAGSIFRSSLRTVSNAHFTCGCILGLATVVFAYALNIPFDQQTEQITFVQGIGVQERAAKLQRLMKLKELLTLVVSIFGAGVSGGLIVSAISEHRKSHDPILSSAEPAQKAAQAG